MKKRLFALLLTALLVLSMSATTVADPWCPPFVRPRNIVCPPDTRLCPPTDEIVE